MKRGFTLIEILVSTAIFSIVMVVALGSLLAVSSAGRKAETVKSVINNLDFALESMSRTIRTGVYYHCGNSNISGSELAPQDCSSGGTYFVFKSNEAATPYVAYCLSGNSIWRMKSATVAGIGTSCGSGAFLQMTAPEVKISNFTFYVTGSLSYPTDGVTSCGPPPVGSDCAQPKVTMTISGYIALGDTASSSSIFNIQTSAVQRLYDQ